MQLCTVAFLPTLVAVSAGAQTSAFSPTNDERCDAIDSQTPVLRSVPSGTHPMRAYNTHINVEKVVIEEFVKAWRISRDGQSACEGVVLIFRMEGRGYTGRSLGFTNEYGKFTFKWNPAAVAVVHTHPNNSDPKPSEQDRRVADKFGVPIFTITISGMYMYNPATKQTSKVLDGLDWLDPVNLSRWAQEIGRGVDTSV
jgi:hypothetical protein